MAVYLGCSLETRIQVAVEEWRQIRPRVCGESFKCYTVWNDANRLDGTFPIPQLHVLDEIKELLLDDH